MKHEPCFVQALFLHVIETELQDELRAKLCQLLEVASVRTIIKKIFSFILKNYKLVIWPSDSRTNMIETTVLQFTALQFTALQFTAR